MTTTIITNRRATCPTCHKVVRADYSATYDRYYLGTHLRTTPITKITHRCPESGFAVSDALLVPLKKD